MSRVEWAPPYDAAEHGYDLATDPRCLYGWGCKDGHRFGHLCWRPYRHPGRCMERVEDRQPCESAQRPKNWDETGRREANS